MTTLQQTPGFTEFSRPEDDEGLHPGQYLEILWKRKFYLVLPFLAVLAIGISVAMLWPPTFSSEAKILVESQQIPVELVRPTVTAGAKERLQVIEQRVMTRENLLAIIAKYGLFADQRQRLSQTELFELMKESAKVAPIELLQRGRNETVIAVTIGFSHRRADVAMQVANELVTLFLNEDARSRTARAMETTKFLAREVQKLESDLAAVEVKIAQLRVQQQQVGSSPPDTPMTQLATLRAELAQKSSVYSQTHPEIRRLKGQISALEKLFGAAAPTTETRVDQENIALLDALQQQRKAIQKNIEDTAQKLATARTGENLERGQFSERLEVLEQAILPQKPVKPNRPRIIALAFFFAAMVGLGGVFAAETLDRTIRGSRDLLTVAGGHAFVAIPYISTQAELTRSKSKAALIVGSLIVAVVVALTLTHFLVRPLDELWTIFITRLFPSWPF